LFLSLSASAEPSVISSFEDDVPASAGAEHAATTTGFGGFVGVMRRRFLRQSNNSNRSIARKRIEPTTIATMAPVERFLDFFFGLSAGRMLSGVGAGKNGLHVVFNSGPQRSKFPANDASGNLESVFGI